MRTVPLSQRSQLPLWRTVLWFGFLLVLANAVAAFWVEEDSGSCMFILPGSFYGLLVCLPVLGTRRFGVATIVHLIPALPVQFYTVPLPAMPPTPSSTVCRGRSSPLRSTR